MKTLIFAMAGACLLVACNFSPSTNSASNNNAPATQVIQSFLPSLKTKLIQSFNIDAQNGGTIVTREGSELQIPANCFINPDGSPVKGTVNLSFAQYDNPLEIIASGIPMAITEAGVEHIFESAGMFQLNGSADGKDIKIAEGKNITVSLNTSYTDTNYSFFRFDETKQNWVTLQNPNTLAANTILPQKSAAPAISAEEIPEKPLEIQAHNANTPVFELNVDTKGMSQINAYKNILWTYAGNGADPFKSDLLTVKWDNIVLQRSASMENAYDAVCRKGERTITTTVKPVLYGSQLKRAQQEYQRLLNEYNSRMEMQKALVSRAETAGKAQRMLSVSSFGVYNCDRYTFGPNLTETPYGFKAIIPGASEQDVVKYYIVNPDVNTAVYLYATNSFKLRNDCDNYLLAILANEKVAVCDPAQVEKLKNNTSTSDLTFRVSPKTLDETADFISVVNAK